MPQDEITMYEEMKDLIALLKIAGVSADESLGICLTLNGRQMDKLSRYILDNNPSR